MARLEASNAEPCAWSQRLRAAAGPSATFCEQLQCVSALFDVGVTREIKVRVPLAFSQKGYASFPLPLPCRHAGCYTTCAYRYVA